MARGGHNFIDLTGKVFGRLTVIGRSYDYPAKPRYPAWTCQCECGTVRIVIGDNLRRGETKSCCCYIREFHTKHGHGSKINRSPTYGVWSSMIGRCTNDNDDAWHYYGGRGITVCDRWRHFPNFLEDMGEKPHRLTLERNDVNLGYCKENCRWATYKEQARNTRANRFLEIDGINLTVSEWAERAGINYGTLRNRLNNLGWDARAAVFTPALSRNMTRKAQQEIILQCAISD